MLTKLYAGMMTKVNLLKGEEGQGMVEYALIVGLIALVVIGAITLLGTTIDGKFNDIVTGLTTP